MGSGSKIGAALALAIGCALVYIALAGNGGKLLALFGTASQPATTPTNGSGTVATTPSATALAPAPFNASQTLSLTPSATIASIESASGFGLSSGSSLLEQELGISTHPAAVTGSSSGTTGSLFPPTFSGGTYLDDTPTLGTQATQAQAPADTGLTYVPQATIPAGLDNIDPSQTLGLDSGGA